LDLFDAIGVALNNYVSSQTYGISGAANRSINEGFGVREPSPLAPVVAPADYYNEAGQYGHYETEWLGNDLQTTWVPYVAPAPASEVGEMWEDEWDMGDMGDVSEVFSTSDESSDSGVTLGDIYDVYDEFGGGAGSPDGGGMVRTASAGGVVAAGGVWLGSLLARRFGRSGAAQVYTFANNLKVRASQLWDLVRSYGPARVAAAAGISAATLGAMLAATANTRGRRKRRRGISASNISTARRVISFNKRLSRQLGIRGGRGRSYSRPRRAHYHRFN